jgi:hypothetical protein
MTTDQNVEWSVLARGAEMARRTIVMLEDDLDGGPADETLRFGIDGSEYEIDLNDKNAARFHKVLAPFVERARRAGRVPRRAVRRTAASRRRSHDMRMWARRQGIELSERGRIPSYVAERYEAAMGAGTRQPEKAGRGRRRLARGRSTRGWSTRGWLTRGQLTRGD